MQKIKISLFILLGVLTMAACKKDDAKTVTDYLTASGWKLTTQTYDDDGSGPNAAQAETIDACDLDDTMLLKSDKTLSYDEGATKCDPNDPQTGSGSWSLSADEKTITLIDNSFPLPFAFSIVQIDDNTLVLDFNDGQGVTRTTYTH